MVRQFLGGFIPRSQSCNSYLRDGRIRESWYWEANWPTEQGLSAKATFSVNEFGEEMARQMAVRARQDGVAAVKGDYWASKRGSTDKEPSAGEQHVA